MYIKFTKEHVAGFPTGYVANVDARTGTRLIENKQAEEIKQEVFAGNSSKNVALMTKHLAEKREEAAKLSKAAKKGE